MKLPSGSTSTWSEVYGRRSMAGRGGWARGRMSNGPGRSLNEGAQSIAPTIRRADLADAATWILSQETGGNDR